MTPGQIITELEGIFDEEVRKHTEACNAADDRARKQAMRRIEALNLAMDYVMKGAGQ